MTTIHTQHGLYHVDTNVPDPTMEAPDAPLVEPFGTFTMVLIFSAGFAIGALVCFLAGVVVGALS